MIHQVNYSEARRRLRDLIEAAMRGETVIITTRQDQQVQLVPLTGARPHPKFGSAAGLIKMSDDFDEPLTDFCESGNPF